MKEYPKIQTVWKRDPETKYKTLLAGQFARPEFEYLKKCEWIWTEKIDGTNIRVIFSHEVIFRGKTDNAQIPPFLERKLEELFPFEKMDFAFGESEICLYGEGYGARIQKGGGNYISDGVGFILFDVLIDRWWLQREQVEDIAYKLGIPVVPVVGLGYLETAIKITKGDFSSALMQGGLPAEGLVMFPKELLFDRAGRRIITKIKAKDFEKQDA